MRPSCPHSFEAVLHMSSGRRPGAARRGCKDRPRGLRRLRDRFQGGRTLRSGADLWGDYAMAIDTVQARLSAACGLVQQVRGSSLGWRLATDARCLVDSRLSATSGCDKAHFQPSARRTVPREPPPRTRTCCTARTRGAPHRPPPRGPLSPCRSPSPLCGTPPRTPPCQARTFCTSDPRAGPLPCRPPSP